MILLQTLSTSDNIITHRFRRRVTLIKTSIDFHVEFDHCFITSKVYLEIIQQRVRL